MLEQDQFGELLANVRLVDVHGGLLGSMKQTNPAVALDDGLNQKENMVSVNRAVSHVRI